MICIMICIVFFQRLESFLKLEAILIDHIDRNSDGFLLYKSLKQFTLLAFSQFITSDDVNQMNILATDIVHRYVNFCQANNFSQDVYCKLHTLLHYGQLVQRFGPLYQFGTFRYEHKHQYGKAVARVIRCFINTSKTIHGNHQVLRALTSEQSEFSRTDFWTQEDSPQHSTLTTLSGVSNTKLKTSDQPFSLGKNIIRKIKGTQDWFMTHEFCSVENGGIYAKGTIMNLLSANELTQSDLPKLSEGTQQLYILVANLNHSNDFVFRHNGNCYLLEWI